LYCSEAEPLGKEPSDGGRRTPPLAALASSVLGWVGAGGVSVPADVGTFGGGGTGVPGGINSAVGWYRDVLALGAEPLIAIGPVALVSEIPEEA